MERSAQLRHAVTQRRLYWLLVSIVVILGGVGLLIHNQKQQQTATSQMGDTLDTIADKLLTQVSEKDQEIGSLKVQLEAAIQRAAHAEARGNPDAREALTELRKDGDPRALSEFLEQQLAKNQGERIELLRERAAVAYVSGEIERAEQCLREILAALPDDLDATNRLGHIYRLRGDLDAASRQYQRLLDLALDDQTVKAVALGNLGLIADTRGDLDEAERLYRESLAIDKQLGRLEGQANQLGNLGFIAQIRGDLDEAERLHQEALAINKQLGRLEGQANQLGNLGAIAKQRGNLAKARQLWTEARDLFARVGAKPQQEQAQELLNELPPE